MLSSNVISMVKDISSKCLLPPVEDRGELETKFAEAVGAALDASMDGLEKAHKDAIDIVSAEEDKVQNLQNGLDESNSLKEKADGSLAEANEEESEATKKLTEAEAALATHTQKEKALQPKKT